MRSRLRYATQKAQDALKVVDRLADYLPDRAAGMVKGHPRMNLYQEPDTYVYRGEMPGVSRKDLELTMQGRELTITGEKKPPEQEGEVRKQERAYGSFSRTVTLPDDADIEQEPDATLKNGVLRITVARKGAKAAKNVEISGEGENETNVSVGEKEDDESDAEQSE